MYRQVQKLLLGNGVAQALQFGSIIILARLYPPSAFGILAQVQSLATVAAIVVTLQLHLSIPACKNTTAAAATVASIEALALTFLAVALPASLVFSKTYSLAALLALAIGLSNTYGSFLVYGGRFGRLSIFYVGRAVLMIVIQLTLAFAKIPDGLVLGAVAAESLAAVVLRVHALRGQRALGQSLVAVRALVRERSSYSLYGTLQELVSVAAFYAPLFLFSEKYGTEVGGQYAMASRLIWAPTILVSRSITQVLYHRFGRQPPRTRSELVAMVVNRRVLGVVALIMLCGLALPKLGLLVLGEKWRLAAKLLPVLVAWAGVFLLSIPFRAAGRILEAQRSQLLVDAAMLLGIAAVFTLIDIDPVHAAIGLVFLATVQNLGLAWAVALLTLKGRVEPAVSGGVRR